MRGEFQTLNQGLLKPAVEAFRGPVIARHQNVTVTQSPPVPTSSEYIRTSLVGVGGVLAAPEVP